jgi:hypothetical protein
MKKLYTVGLMAVMFAACKPNLKTQAPTKGNADFSSYIAVGNSLTAGYADNTLYLTGQQNSYPLRLSQQFALVGGGVFKQPLLTSDVGFPVPRLVLANIAGCNGVVSLTPVLNAGVDSVDNVSIASQGPFNNLGVPGIRCYDYVVAGYAGIAAIGGTPYASRFYDDPGNETPMDVLNKTMAKLNPTFFTCWLGNNDVLLYATGGGQGTNPQYLSTFYRPGNITPTPVFQAIYDSVVKTLVKGGAKGVLMNIPDVTSVPLFNTIPANGLVLRQGQADTLNGFYAAQGITNMTFTAGANYFVITDHTGNVRQAQSGEYILLNTPTDSLTCYGMGSIKAIPNQYVLTKDEVSNIQTATAAYNNVIQQAATTYHLAYVDMNSFLKTFSNTGFLYNGVKFNAQFVTGGAFSLDGVHLTPRGYAIVANYIIANINSYYNATVPAIDINQYSGIKFP